MGKQLGRITINAIGPMAEMFWETGNRGKDFNPIAMPRLGYGVEECDHTEADYYESVTFLIDAVKEEGSRVFILGVGPRMIPSTWIKAAELVIQGSKVEIVLIPHCKIIENREEDLLIYASILYVNRTGIYKVEEAGKISAKLFRENLAKTATALNKEILVKA